MAFKRAAFVQRSSRVQRDKIRIVENKTQQQKKNKKSQANVSVQDAFNPSSDFKPIAF